MPYQGAEQEQSLQGVCRFGANATYSQQVTGIIDDDDIGDKAFSNPPSDLTSTEKTAVRTAINAGGSAVATQSAKGQMSSADKTKLDGIESNATADQTGAEMVTALDGLSGNSRLQASSVRGLATVATTGAYGDLSGRPTIPTDTTIFKGAWTANTSYAVGNIVTRTNDVYICITANSDATFTASKWEQLDVGSPTDITNVAISGTTITVSRRNGTTFTLTTQDTTYSNATQSTAGLQSSADKTKLDGIATQATKNQAGAGTTIGSDGEVNIDNPFTDADETKLDGIATGAEVNVNPDWNASSGDAQILNKPTIPSATPDATTTVKGKVEKSTSAENTAGTAEDVYPDVKGVKRNA